MGTTASFVYDPFGRRTSKNMLGTTTSFLYESVLTYQIGSFIEERGLKRIDKTFVVLGMVIAGFLTWYAYYSNSHRGSPNLGWFTYVALCPSSIFLMLTENAKTAWEQALIIAVVVVSNGTLYGAVCFTVREFMQTRTGT